MSSKLTDWAWQQRVESPSVKYVLLALADIVNDAGVFYGSIAMVAEKTGLNTKTVRNAIHHMVEIGLLSIIATPHGRPVEYLIRATPLPKTGGVPIPETVATPPKNGRGTHTRNGIEPLPKTGDNVSNNIKTERESAPTRLALTSPP